MKLKELLHRLEEVKQTISACGEDALNTEVCVRAAPLHSVSGLDSIGINSIGYARNLITQRIIIETSKLMVTEQLLRDVPKPIFARDDYNICPNCENCIEIFEAPYCCYCGQKLDWENAQ